MHGRFSSMVLVALVLVCAVCAVGATRYCETKKCERWSDTAHACESSCGPCQKCHHGSCKSKCKEYRCEVCSHGYGEGSDCTSRCAPDEYCNQGSCEPHESPEPECGPCEVATEYGCDFDEELMDKCGKCPGHDAYGACTCMDGPVAFAGGLSVGGYKNIAWHISKQYCNITALKQYVHKCHEDADCADCDPCTVDACEYEECTHTPVEFDAHKRCGPCEAFEPDDYGNRCDDHNACTFDRCVRGSCTHMLEHGCKRKEKVWPRPEKPPPHVVDDATV